MQSVEISVSFASIMGALSTAVGGYIIWSAKRFITDMEKRCDKQEERLSDVEKCVSKIVTHHEINHGQRIECDL